MQTTKAPSKEQVREWLTQRWRTYMPPPTLQEVRAQLGWVLNDHFQAGQCSPVRKLKDAT